MTPTFLYAVEKTSLAMRALTVSHDPLRTRLENAFVFSLSRLRAESFPPELRDRFTAIRAALTWAEDERLGSIAATIGLISDAECLRVAGLIFSFHEALTEREGARMHEALKLPPPAPVVAAPASDPADEPACEIADLLRDVFPPAKLAEVVSILASELPG
jgi:hypothetical protein